MSAGARRPKRPESADIAFTAEVRAEELRFCEVPQTRTEFTGVPAYESGSGSERAHLPERVEKDVTYRGVRVHYWLAAKVIYPSQAGADGAQRPASLRPHLPAPCRSRW
jgi:hypothetical protein